MSSDTFDNNSFDLNENVTFVKLLSKYKIILERSTSIFNKKKLDRARLALTKEFNQQCQTNFTVKQILRKLNNTKSRLKEKNYKNLSRSKQIPFSKWERMFLDLWVGNGVTVDTSDPSKLEKQLNNGISDESIRENVSVASIEVNTPETILPESEDTAIKLETDYHLIDESQQTSSETSTHIWVPQSVSEQGTRFINANDDKYESMSLDELKRAVLISQLRTLKAEEDAARSKEKLNLYKLSLLQNQ